MQHSPFGSLREIVALAGLPEPDPAEIVISGDDPVFPTPYRVGAAGAAALAATGLAASELWALRTGRRQRVAVDLRAAAASLRSFRYLRVGGTRPPEPRDSLSGFHPVAHGRWINIHCNFPHHRAAALSVLAAPAERTAVEAKARLWRGEALEDAIHSAGGCAGLARSPEEWARHPHCAAVGAQPLIEISPIGEAPPEPLPPGSRPLAGVRVLDLTRVLAGPTCARTLAEHGADVLKITAAHLPDSGAVELDTGIGKLAARIDLRTAQGIDTLQELVRQADIFSQSYRPGALARRGFSPEALAALAPRHRLRQLERMGAYRSMARAARLRHHRADGKRHGARFGRRQPAQAAASLGDRLCQRVPHGLWCHGGAGAPGYRRWQLAGARRPPPHRPLDRRPRSHRSLGARRCAAGTPRRRNRTPVGRDGRAGGTHPSSHAGGQAVGDTLRLAAAAGAARS
jgi:crotonobetainyl-CoA:carnitine CoA-transferase CaiB-like acyl-CoA transferase